jgi:D-cysteine desulfhydrase
LKCELILNDQKPVRQNGNLLLDELLGAKCHWIERPQFPVRLSELPEQLRAQGRKPYVIGIGGSNGVGATGYVLAMIELEGQLRTTQHRVDHIVFASSSGGTQAGMVLGAQLAGFGGQLHGVSVDKDNLEREAYDEEVAKIANECAQYIGSDIRLTKQHIKIVYGYTGEGYGVVSNLEREAIRLMARNEGVILDPVYTGRAFGGLIDLIRKGAFKRGESVLFWHTGGAPALFAYAKELA